MNEFENVTAPPSPPAGTAPQEDRTVALIVHLTGIVTGFIVPLIIWLVNKDNPSKAWLNDQSKEALNFQITVFIALFVSGVLTAILIGMLLLPLVGLANLVFCILAGIKANEGVSYRYPFALRLMSNRVARVEAKPGLVPGFFVGDALRVTQRTYALCLDLSRADAFL